MSALFDSLGSKGLLVETDSDSDNDEAAAAARRARVLTSAVAKKCAGTLKSAPPTALPARDRARSRKSPMSPSLNWNGRPSPPSIAAAQPAVTLVPERQSVPSCCRCDTLLEHVLYLTNSHQEMKDMMVQFQGQMTHLLKESAAVHGRPQFYRDMPPVYDPRADERPRPGPKDEFPSRGLEPMEQSVLIREIHNASLADPTKRLGFRRIVDPLHWHEPVTVHVNLHSASAKLQWKLWHYAFKPNATLQTVLTPSEMVASETKKGRDTPPQETLEARPPNNRPLISSESHLAMQSATLSVMGATKRAVDYNNELSKRTKHPSCQSAGGNDSAEQADHADGEVVNIFGSLRRVD